MRIDVLLRKKCKGVGEKIGKQILLIRLIYAVLFSITDLLDLFNQSIDFVFLYDFNQSFPYVNMYLLKY